MIQQFPDLPVSRSGFGLVPASKLLISPYNQVEEVWEEPGDKWKCTLQFNFLTRDEFRTLRSHLISLRGHIGITAIYDTAHSNLALTSQVLVADGAGQYGVTLNVRGAQPNTLVARSGDRFQLGSRLHEVTEDATSNGTGQVVLKFQPEIIKPTTDSQALITDNPRGAFRIADPNSIPTWAGNKTIVRSIQIDFLEALNT